MDWRCPAWSTARAQCRGEERSQHEGASAWRGHPTHCQIDQLIACPAPRILPCRTHPRSAKPGTACAIDFRLFPAQISAPTVRPCVEQGRRANGLSNAKKPKPLTLNSKSWQHLQIRGREGERHFVGGKPGKDDLEGGRVDSHTSALWCIYCTRSL